ncbi:MAG: exodeoxyribonuclease V subunit gamma, partial [Candidatus Accumulibacter sp.]|nr:exodeoxyribonuclease V subunit gamma [Accumulibacter sp.]
MAAGPASGLSSPFRPQPHCCPEPTLSSPAPEPGLIVVHGNQPEILRGLVVAWMKRYPLAPLDNESILVQSNGIAQWLKMALAADAGGSDGEAGGCGIAAGLEVSLPARFLWQAYRALLGRDAVPESSPFDEERLLWRLLRLLPELGSRPEYAPLHAFLAHDSDQRKRFQLAERLADLFDQYQVYRADWLAAWAAGSDALPDGRGNSRPLPAGQRWQA